MRDQTVRPTRFPCPESFGQTELAGGLGVNSEDEYAAAKPANRRLTV
jgi:hypothetical protein